MIYTCINSYVYMKKSTFLYFLIFKNIKCFLTFTFLTSYLIAVIIIFQTSYQYSLIYFLDFGQNEPKLFQIEHYLILSPSDFWDIFSIYLKIENYCTILYPEGLWLSVLCYL